MVRSSVSSYSLLSPSSWLSTSLGSPGEVSLKSSSSPEAVELLKVTSRSPSNLSSGPPISKFSTAPTPLPKPSRRPGAAIIRRRRSRSLPRNYRTCLLNKQIFQNNPDSPMPDSPNIPLPDPPDISLPDPPDTPLPDPPSIPLSDPPSIPLPDPPRRSISLASLGSHVISSPILKAKSLSNLSPLPPIHQNLPPIHQNLASLKRNLSVSASGDLVWFDPGVGYVIPGEVMAFHKQPGQQSVTVQAIISGK
ncbi:unnamed protein product, partial [Cyprideis torosa]